MSAREIYQTAIRQLSAMDRLQLASIILQELAAAQGAGLELRDDWNDQDVADLMTFAASHASRSVPFEDKDA